MKLKWPLLLLTFAFPLLAEEQSPNFWLTSYEEAIKESKASSKPLLMLFTGSGWCGWCQKLDKEVLKTSTFFQEVGNKFVFLKLDFPNYRAKDPQLDALQRKYEVSGFPTIILLDTQQMQVIGKMGYQKGGPQTYAAQLLKLISNYSSYKQKAQAVEMQKFSGAELKQLYEKAKQLDIYTDVNRIIKVGLLSDEKLFFQLERYRFLATEGSPRDAEAIALRSQLLAADPQNKLKLPYQLAVIDFEAFSAEVEKEGYSPEMAVRPLVAYIEQFGAQDPENLWRLEMIISQVYLDQNKIPQALQYAQSSHDAAPTTVQPEIAKAIRNIQIFAQMH